MVGRVPKPCDFCQHTQQTTLAGLEEWNKTNGTYSSDGVAPVSPRSLTCGLLSRATLVGDEVSVEALGGQERGKGLDIEGFIIVGVAYES